MLVRPAHQRLEAGDAATLEIDQRLVIGLQHVVLDGVAQIDLDAAAALRARVHFRFKEAERPEPFALGARQRHVGILEQLLGVVAVAGRNRDADAGAADNAVSVEQIRLADRSDQAARQHGDLFRPRDAGLHHGKFIGAETRDGVFFPQGRPQALGHALEQLVADGMTQRVVDGLKVVEVEKQDRNLVAAATGVRQQFIEPLAQQDAVGQPGQAVMLRHKGKAGLGALALRDVHQGQQDRRAAFECQVTRIDRHIDQRAVRLDMLPCSRGAFFGALVAAPRRRLIECLHVGDFQLLEVVPRIAIVGDCGVVHAENTFVILRADDHRHRITVEQQPERRLALLQFGDIDAQTDHAAIAGLPLVDQDAAAICQHLLMGRFRMIHLLETLVDPFVFAPDRFRIVAASDADLQRVAQPRALREQIRTLGVNFGVFLVPENVAAIGVEKHDTLRKNVDGFAQTRIRLLSAGNGRLGLGALADDLPDPGIMTMGRNFRLRLQPANRQLPPDMLRPSDPAF